MADTPLLHEGGAEGTPFAVCVVTQPGRVEVSVSGEIDLTTREAFERVLESACALGPHVRLDLSGVAFLDPQGARLLARRQLAHPLLEVTRTSAAVRRIVDILSQLEAAGTQPHRQSGPACDAAAP
jgi:anti-anti-sigma factor